MYVKYRQDNLHRMTLYTNTCGIMAMLALWSNMWIIGPWIQWLFVASAALTDGHYRTDIIRSVGHPRSDSVVALVLCTVVCNGWGTETLYYRSLGIVPTLLRMDAVGANLGDYAGFDTGHFLGHGPHLA